jgi:transcriptional regulator with XRE-family HTH domain
LLNVRQALGMNQGEFAEAMNISRRTAIRWQKGQSSPGEAEIRQLAAMVREEDDDLADELLAAALLAPEPKPEQPAAQAEAAPIAPAPALPPPVQPPGVPPAHAIDAIVCVAADAANMVPRAMRPALRAAFARAAELGVSVEAVAQGLADP